jgi:hypothetical protein
MKKVNLVCRFEYTTQVSEDSWRRVTKTLEVEERTTMGEILQYAEDIGWLKDDRGIVFEVSESKSLRTL